MHFFANPNLNSSVTSTGHLRWQAHPCDTAGGRGGRGRCPKIPVECEHGIRTLNCGLVYSVRCYVPALGCRAVDSRCDAH